MVEIKRENVYFRHQKRICVTIEVLHVGTGH